MGIRKKIIVAFTALGLLLFFSGMVSMFELNKLSKNTHNILESSSRNMELSKRMLDAVQDQNTALLQMIVVGDKNLDTLYMSGRRDFDKALAEATVTIKDLTDLDSIYSARENYNKVIETHLYQTEQENIDWFVSIYKTSYYRLTSAIKNYMISSQNSLGNKASQIENNAYRAITPGIIALAVAIVIILMFFFLLDLYYIQPILKITKGLKGYVVSKVPFNVKMEGKDEVFQLKDLIEALITQSKTKKTE